MKRVDAYLSRKAAVAWPGAIVEDWDRVFLLQRPGLPAVELAGEPLPLDKRFRAAKEALGQLIEHERAKRA